MPELAPARERPSLQSRMLWRLLLPLAATWSIGSAVAFYLSWVLAGHAFDHAMLDDARVLAANVVERNGALVLNLSPHEVDNVLFDSEELEYFAIVAADGKVVASNDGLPPAALPKAQASDFADASLNGMDLRTARLRVEAGLPFTVVIGQTTRSRSRLLKGLLTRSLAPQVALLLILGVYLWHQISRELAPLRHLQRELDRRDSSELEPISFKPVSSDVGRLRDAVNSLLARVQRGVQAQREFAGNVAHDLRTPLAGIRALAAYGLARDQPDVWRQQLRSIVQSEERASRLVDQLLALALADEARDSVRLEAVRADELTRRVLLTFVARADSAGVDLGAAGLDTPVCARASPVLLEGILTNLIDNALRYGTGGATASLTVEVARRAGEVLISVTDTGPGLEPGQTESLSRRWAQGMAGLKLGEGAGLGLAIAARYAELMGGRLELGTGPEGRGLRASVSLLAWPATGE
jgi:two-component system sensor histidine kinase TctE